MNTEDENWAMSIFGAVNLFETVLPTPRRPVGAGPAAVGGKLRVTMAGTVNCPALTLSVHMKVADRVALPTLIEELPMIWTREVGSPPLHLTLTPCERLTLVIWS